MKPIPYGRQHITDDDIQAVNEVLRGEYLTQGPAIKKFEDEFAAYVNSKYAVAVSNGTAALHLCALALDVQPGQKVLTTPITFAASANCIRYCGGEVEFVDIDPATYLIDLNNIEEKLKSAAPGTYAGVVAVDFAGRPVDLKRLRSIADEHGLWIIEDACHAPGGYSPEQSQKVYCGSGKYAELAIFSFHPVKHIASGEGGMITTNDETLYNKLMMLRTHGITRDVSRFANEISWAAGNATTTPENFPGWYMEMQTLGYNYRLTDFQAALGSSQLKRADAGLERRIAIAKTYENEFKGAFFIKGQSGYVDGHAYHLYVIEVDDRLGLYNFLRERKIFAQVHYIPTHLMPYYRDFGWKEGDMPLAETYYSRCLSLPMYPTLTEEEQQYVIDSIKEFYA
ncbi:MAG: UDP-4-amino-4,6-dideoxy-N-acetyl-beta-L-altrosamine transaminase [Flavitalea sp.]